MSLVDKCKKGIVDLSGYVPVGYIELKICTKPDLKCEYLSDTYIKYNGEIYFFCKKDIGGDKYRKG